MSFTRATSSGSAPPLAKETRLNYHSHSVFSNYASTGMRRDSEGYVHGGPCLGDSQTETYLKDMDMTSLASAWAIARRRPI